MVLKPYTFSDRPVRHYIAQARTIRPTVSAQVSKHVVDSYVRLRKMSKDDEAQNKSHTYTSARTLLGILRLSQALARLRTSSVVDYSDVDEALRLMECSKESLYEDDEQEREPDKSAVSQIYRLIKSMKDNLDDDENTPVKRRRTTKRIGKGPGGERDMDVDEPESGPVLSMVDVRARVTTAGYTEAQLVETIDKVSAAFDVVRIIALIFFYSTRNLACWQRYRMVRN